MEIYSMKKNEKKILGFDIGGTKIAVCLGDGTGKIINSERISSIGISPEEVLEKIAKTGDKLLEGAGIDKSSLDGIGLGAPGPMDIQAGTISPANMKGWRDVPIKSFLENYFQIETYFDNDANAAALAEWLFGAGSGVDNMIYLTMSTGIGAGIIADGHLLRGASGIAGECGHVIIELDGPECNCGQHGCYEAFCGGRAIAQRMQKELQNDNDHPIVKFAGGDISKIDMICLEKAVRSGNKYALDLWDEMCVRNAQAMGMFLNIFNPEKLVLGTLAWATGDLFMEPVLKYLPRFCWKQMHDDCKVEVCGLGREIGEYSGISTALYALYEAGKWNLPWQQ
jgi:glucokinase